MFGWKLSAFEITLLVLALVAVSAVILMLAAPTKWVHRLTGDRGDKLEPHSHPGRNERQS